MHKIKQKILQATIVGVCVFLIFAHASATTAGDEVLLITEGRVVQLVNDERSTYGIPLLEESVTLRTVAQKKLQNMREQGYFAHVSPQGEDPWEWFAQSGYDFSYAGENLATAFSTAQGQHNAWMKSPAHKKNILNKKFDVIGIAVGTAMIDGKEQSVTVQVFAAHRTVAVTSPNYTPQTFEVSEESIHRGNDDVKDIISQKNHDNSYSQAGLMTPNGVRQVSLNELEVNKKRLLAWAIVGASVLFTILIEYRIFSRKLKREKM